MNIIFNANRTPDGTVIVSKHRHDYVTYVDKNGKTYMVDGGLDYQRRSANGDEFSIVIHDDAPHDVQRAAIYWGSRGVNGDQPVTYKLIKDMETTHIEAVLRECNPMEQIKNCMEKELEFRSK